MTDKKKESYNWVRKSNNYDLRQEIEDDESQIEALLVDCGITDLMFERE